MSNPSILWSPAPYHIISYSTLLGASIYQSFINGIVSYRALPRPQFSILQEKLTPVYFALQTTLPVLMALTYPASPTPTLHTHNPPLHGASALLQLSSSGIVGVLEEGNRWTVLAPLVGMFVCAAANLLVLGPGTTRVMHERKRQEVRDGKKSYEEGPKSGEMERLNRRFGMWHGGSALVNVVGIGIEVWYGFLLAGRMV